MNQVLYLSDDEQAARDRNILIAKQNDRFRSTWGADFTVAGQIVMTRSVAEMPPSTQAQIMTAVQGFDTFNEDNDPYLDHTFGTFEVTKEGEEIKLYWKIDLYDTAYVYGSEEPENPEVTRRVLTILQPSEY